VITAWRIVRKEFVDDVFSGEGARLYAGRWHSAGHRLIYTASNLSLATLELMVNTPRALLLRNYVVASCTFAEVIVEELDFARLPSNWRDYPAPAQLQKLGVEWLLGESSAVLSVPSAVTPEERNYLINPEHEHFRSVDCGIARPFDIDVRLLTYDTHRESAPLIRLRHLLPSKRGEGYQCNTQFRAARDSVASVAFSPPQRGEGGRRPDEGLPSRWDSEWKPAIARRTQSCRTSMCARSPMTRCARISVVASTPSRARSRHHSLNATTMLPLGDLLVHVREWTGASPAEVLPLFRGSSRVSQGAADELDDLAQAINANADADVAGGR
jgi:RES domain-containing protein